MCIELDPTCFLLFPSRPLRKRILLAQRVQAVRGSLAKPNLRFCPVLESLCSPTAPAETLSLLRSSGKDSFMAKVLRAVEPSLCSYCASGPILPADLAPGRRFKCRL